MAANVVDLGKPGSSGRIADILSQKVAAVMKSAATETMRQLSVNTPVASGRLRYGYYCTVRAPSVRMPNPRSYDIPDIQSRMNILERVKITDRIYITNNVPYGIYLNNGTVKMAPRYFIERSVNMAVQLIQR